jgi:hypothetical protein
MAGVKKVVRIAVRIVMAVLSRLTLGLPKIGARPEVKFQVLEIFEQFLPREILVGL